MFKWVSAHIAGCQGTLAALRAWRLRRCAMARVRRLQVAVARLASISSRTALCALTALTGITFVSAAPIPGNLGRTATPAEIRTWDIDVRPDFKGLPPGSGTVARGQEIWETKCESCHGAFGESNEVFTPIIGHTTKDDIRSGHVAALRSATVPQRTTLMKLSELSVLWDYINRAMPWNAPKSLSTDDVYAVVAYVLNLGGVVPENFVLSEKNMQATQNLLPNRNGKTREHGLCKSARNQMCRVQAA